MKRVYGLLILVLLFSFSASFCNGQTWGSWIDVGQGVQVSFRFGKQRCFTGNTYARLRNTSNVKYASIRVEFYTNCNSTDPSAVSAYNLAPNQINESSGNWYTTDLSVSKIRLTKLEDANYKNLLSINAKHNQNGLPDSKEQAEAGAGEQAKAKKKEEEEMRRIEREAREEKREIDRRLAAIEQERRREEAESARIKMELEAQQRSYSPAIPFSATNSSTRNLTYKNQRSSDAIDAVGKVVWNIIQNNKAEKASNARSIVQSYAGELNSKKKGLIYYQDVLCNKCNGTGIYMYKVASDDELSGKSRSCDQCNKLGRWNKLTPEFDLTFAQSHSPELLELIHYLLEQADGNSPVSKITPVGYKGYIDVLLRIGIGAHYDDPVFINKTLFQFRDRKGEYDDINVSLRYYDREVRDMTIYPLSTIKTFVVMSEKHDDTGIQYYRRVRMETTFDNSLEFMTKCDPDIFCQMANGLLAKLKEVNGIK